MQPQSSLASLEPKCRLHRYDGLRLSEYLSMALSPLVLSLALYYGTSYILTCAMTSLIGRCLLDILISARISGMRERRAWLKAVEAEPRAIWIVKPPASSCGRGIRLVTRATVGSVSKAKKCLVQVCVFVYLSKGV